MTVVIPVGASMQPAAMLTIGLPGICQNSDEPHSEQNPRRASCSLSGLSIHRSPRSSENSSSSNGAAVAGQACPAHLRHSVQ